MCGRVSEPAASGAAPAPRRRLRPLRVSLPTGAAPVVECQRDVGYAEPAVRRPPPELWSTTAVCGYDPERAPDVDPADEAARGDPRLRQASCGTADAGLGEARSHAVVLFLLLALRRAIAEVQALSDPDRCPGAVATQAACELPQLFFQSDWTVRDVTDGGMCIVSTSAHQGVKHLGPDRLQRSQDESQCRLRLDNLQKSQS